ncbi:Diaminopimelate decarboxylase [Rubripirellula lacrimiformis]|uniref:Diaminopimelate decarboxylase n=1 Tax=Rubripirellula lacrimiformis TaxID=1930273 RepID=A0A517N4G5_9BACT|nr:Y4yA family PLP-dependent enzyme [Rubripirellula lacrimiformis]QDT02023.1 Diaminopimelate decarboxylase [Rubripirellula lacrimiformis]
MLLSSSTPAAREGIEDWRGHCVGSPPLDARVEPWMSELMDRSHLQELVAQHGSPLNLVSTSPMRSNLGQLNQVAEERNLDFQAFFARKSNKCLAFVDEAKQCGAGIDTASENEVRQCLKRGMDPIQIICTAAVKSDSLIRLCLEKAICIAVDNHDELRVVADLADDLACKAVVALRLGGFQHDGQKLQTRFGFDVDHDQQVLCELAELPVIVVGIHFHLDGYDASQRVCGIRESIRWIQRLRDLGHSPSFIDMGGGFPISYLQSQRQWNDFWQQHQRALLGQRDPVTYRNHPLGRHVSGKTVVGKPNSYPYYQTPVRQDWLASILDAETDHRTIADQLRESKIQLRCEPGRSLMDGCGMTVARVEFRKQNANRDWLIGLSMNRTQCRTSSDDFLVDPIVVPMETSETSDPISGYFVGAYCTESELLSLRRMEFPGGIRRGDLVVFPNTAGYLMHFLESRSHQFPLAKNVVVSDDGEGRFDLDGIDR